MIHTSASVGRIPRPETAGHVPRPGSGTRQQRSSITAGQRRVQHSGTPQDRHTPAQAYQARPKAVPTGAPLDTGHYRVRHDRIDNSGVITLRHNSRLQDIRVLDTEGELLRELTLDPTRDYQPQARP